MSNCHGNLGVDHGVDFNSLDQPNTLDGAQGRTQYVLKGSTETHRVDERTEYNNNTSFNHSVNLSDSAGLPNPAMTALFSRHQNPKESRGLSPRTGRSLEYYQVVVRLKPKLKRAPGVYLIYDITSPAVALREEKATVEVPSSLTVPFSPSRSPTPHTDRNIRHADLSSPMRDQTTGSLPLVSQTEGGRKIGDVPSGTIISITKPNVEDDKDERFTYKFNEVVEPSTPDGDMCAKIVPRILEQMNADYNVCVLCYGQIGSGKTHTFNALSQALIKAVFDSIVSTDVVELSFVQIYGNKAYNLLAKSSEKDLLGMPLPKSRGAVVYEPKYLVNSELDAESRRRAAQVYRYTSTHTLNARSSRSHALFSLYITKYRDGVPLSTNKVTLVDLIGSERVEEMGAAAEASDEAIAMNKSLSMLRSYVIADANANDLSAYRDSLLMAYLVPRLQNWHVLLIVTASLDKDNFEITKNSLEFATTSKRRVVEKQKCVFEQRPSLSGFYEQAFTDFSEIIATLRNRVSALQADLRLEWERHDRQARLSSLQFSDYMERRVEVSQSLLRDQDGKQMMLSNDQPRGAVVPCCVEKRETSLERGAGLSEPHDPVIFKEIVDKSTDLFLWLCTQLDELREQRDVLEKRVEDLRAENSRLVSDAERWACEIKQRDENVEKLGNTQRSFMEERDLLKDKIEELHLESFLGYVDRAVCCEMTEIFECVTETRRIDDNDFSRNSLKAAESTTTADQAYLSIQRELEASEKKYEKLKGEWEICSALNKLMWNSCTPQQKMYLSSAKTTDTTAHDDEGTPSRFLIGGDDSRHNDDNVCSSDARAAADYPIDLSFGMESIKLRCVVRDLKAMLEETIYERTQASEESQTLALENGRLRQRLQDEIEKNMCYDKEMRQMVQSMQLLHQQVESSNAYFEGQKNKYADLAAALDRSDEENKRLFMENEKLKTEVCSLKKQTGTAYRGSKEHEPFHMYNTFSALQKHFPVPLTNTLNSVNYGIVGAPTTAGASAVAQGVLHEVSAGRVARKTIVPGRRVLTRSRIVPEKRQLSSQHRSFMRMNSEGNDRGLAFLRSKSATKLPVSHS